MHCAFDIAWGTQLYICSTIRSANPPDTQMPPAAHLHGKVFERQDYPHLRCISLFHVIFYSDGTLACSSIWGLQGVNCIFFFTQGLSTIEDLLMKMGTIVFDGNENFQLRSHKKRRFPFFRSNCYWSNLRLFRCLLIHVASCFHLKGLKRRTCRLNLAWHCFLFSAGVMVKGMDSKPVVISREGSSPTGDANRDEVPIPLRHIVHT